VRPVLGSSIGTGLGINKQHISNINQIGTKPVSVPAITYAGHFFNGFHCKGTIIQCNIPVNLVITLNYLYFIIDGYALHSKPYTVRNYNFSSTLRIMLGSIVMYLNRTPFPAFSISGNAQ
jgi:hypothetical protein